MTLLSQGCNGNTFEELRNGLHLNHNKTIVANQFHEYYSSLQENAGSSSLSIVNKIYVSNKYRINEHFRDVAINKFLSDVESIDFIPSNESACIINQFIEGRTEHKIKNVVDENLFDKETRVVLVNVIYFIGTWKYPLVYYTYMSKKFYISETETVDVNYMRGQHEFNCGDLNDLDARALEMEYANSNYSFIVILPNNRTGLSNLEMNLKNYDLDQIYDQMSVRIASIAIPRFTFETEIELNVVLKNVCF